MLKIEGALILCIIAVLSKHVSRNSLLKYAARHTISLPVKTLVRHISQTIKRVEKQFLLLKVHLMYIYILQKPQIRYFGPFQYERQP